MSFQNLPRIVMAALAMAALTFGSGSSTRTDDHGLIVSGAWVRMAPPTLKVHGAYLTIANHGAEPQELVEASSENYEMVQLHVSRIEDGVATMQHLESVEVPAGGKAEFKPGGLHLMLIKAKKPLEKGMMIPLRLDFRSGATIDVQAMVMADAPDGSEMKEMDHSGHAGHKTH